MQFGPFAVAQLRLMAEIQTLMGVNDASSLPALRLFITDTLGDPYAAQTQFSALTQPIGESRKQANKIKREENITVVIGNPPYKEKAKGRGKGEGARRLDRVRERHIFQGVQQPVCIVLAARPLGKNSKEPAHLRFRSLPAGKREGKFDALSEVSLAGKGWIDGPNGWRDPFLPERIGLWNASLALRDFFVDSSPGMLAGRTWVIAPDSQTLGSRWDALVAEKSPETKAVMFSPTMRGGQLADRHTQKVVRDGLAGHEIRAFTVASDAGKVIAPTRFGFRSFDRQWLIPDNRLLLSARPEMWRAYSNQQTYVTALDAHSPSNGPSLTLTGLIPDQHHYKGSFGGRVFPLWRDAAAKVRT
jgi:hypothetical protein